MSQFKFIAHRGAPLIAPENTLASINKAIELNATCVEIDVHQTKDCGLVVIHDSDLMRTTGETGQVKDYTIKQLMEMDNGSWFDPSFNNERIPELSAVVEITKGKCDLLIEIKGEINDYINIVDHVRVALGDDPAHCIIQSFDPNIVDLFALEPMRKHQLLDFKSMELENIEVLDFLEEICMKRHIEAINFNDHIATTELITLLSSYHKQSYTWTVNNLERVDELKAMGSTGVITDNHKFYSQG